MGPAIIPIGDWITAPAANVSPVRSKRVRLVRIKYENRRCSYRAESFAHVKLGDYYLAGLVTEDDAKATSNGSLVPDYKRAARQYRRYVFGSLISWWLSFGLVRSSSARARFNLAWMYEHGLGVTKDLKEAARLYESALEPEKGAWLPGFLALMWLQSKLLLESDAAQSWRNGRIARTISSARTALNALFSGTVPDAAIGLGCLSTGLDVTLLKALRADQSVVVSCPAGCRQLIRSTRSASASIPVVFGSGPYTDDSLICLAALHSSGVDGGTFSLVKNGMRRDFVSSEQHSVRTDVWQAEYSAFSIMYLHASKSESWSTTMAVERLVRVSHFGCIGHPALTLMARSLALLGHIQVRFTPSAAESRRQKCYRISSMSERNCRSVRR